jgi:hypothetical protein
MGDANEASVVLDLFPRFSCSDDPKSPSTPSFSNALLHQRCSHDNLRTGSRHSSRHHHPGGHRKRRVRTRYMLHELPHIAARIRAIASSFQTVSVSLLYKAYELMRFSDSKNDSSVPHTYERARVGCHRPRAYSRQRTTLLVTIPLYSWYSLQPSVTIPRPLISSNKTGGLRTACNIAKRPSEAGRVRTRC